MKNLDAASIALSKTKIRLMMDPSTIFYATILFSLKTIFKDEITTAATDGIHLFINPTWFLSLTDGQKVGLVYHEVMHVALNHMTRKGARDHKDFNIAADYVINLAGIKAGFTLPPNCLCDPRFKNMNTEQVYAIVHKEAKPKNFDGDIIYTATDKVKDVAGQVSNIVIRAQIQAKQAGAAPGSIPDEIGIILDKNINPKLPWHIILANYLSEFRADDYTMCRINKKYFPDFYLPTLYSEAICDLAVAVDASGSVDDHEFARFIYEIDLIKKTMQPKKMSVIDFDTKIKNIHNIDDTVNPLTDIKFTGRGGTAIGPIMDWAAKNRPEVLLIFTDGEFYLPDNYPPVPIIWLIHGDYTFNPTIGKVIRYKIEEH